MVFEYGKLWKVTLLSQLCFVQMKNKVKWNCSTVRGTQGNRAQRHPFFCGLIMEQVGGRHLPPLQQRSGCMPAVVGDMSQRIATQKCMWDLPSPHMSLRDTEGTRGSNDLPVEAAIVHTFQPCSHTRVARRNVCYTNITLLTENYTCSTPTFSIQVPRSLQLSSKDVSRQGLLSFGFQ